MLLCKKISYDITVLQGFPIAVQRIIIQFQVCSLLRKTAIQRITEKILLPIPKQQEYGLTVVFKNFSNGDFVIHHIKESGSLGLSDYPCFTGGTT
ncbi:MAG: hypothetical protein K2O18_06065 [Oscillospiraceae bacterium]|nr:hypothetical protein [Oscillospiraceae bacterium]